MTASCQNFAYQFIDRKLSSDIFSISCSLSICCSSIDIIWTLKPRVPTARETFLYWIIFARLAGKKVKEKPLATTFLKQLPVYLVSFLLPPLGIWPAIKYLRQADEKSKKIGFLALLLTLISIVITIWLSINLVNSFSRGLNDQLNLYQGLDYQ